ncbi:MAG: sugar transferase [Fibromonadaceae bacterium]|jgi:lipopolysaccharide/colanic/teichoic acid biosynthesis glycosyltransferase|nr:sugar transferase [Fibromonadaceae bacterium]
MGDTERIGQENMFVAYEEFLFPKVYFLQRIKEEIYRCNRRNKCFLWIEIPLKDFDRRFGLQIPFGPETEKKNNILDAWRISVQTILSEEYMGIIGQGKGCIWCLYSNKDLSFLEKIKDSIEKRIKEAGLLEYLSGLNFNAYFYSGKSQSFVQEEDRFIKKWNNEEIFFNIKRISIENLKEKTFRGFYIRLLKRAIDVVGSLFGIVIFFVIMLVCAAIVKRALLKWAAEQEKLGNHVGDTSVIFKQIRVGRNGKLFKCYKFRTMYPGADREKEKLKKQQEAASDGVNRGPTFKMEDDPRILKHGGAFLRRHSLDELPQFLNVLKGDMSLVGPRPPTTDEIKKYEAWHYIRLSVKPGLTCFWQTSGRNNINFEEWMRLDNKYIRDRSTLVDLKLKLKTLEVMLSGKGAS